MALSNLAPRDHPSTRASSRLAGIVLSVGSVLITLCALELGFRIVGAATAAKTIEDLGTPDDGLVRGEAATLGELIRVHPDPKIVYGLLPDLDVEFRGVRTSTNAAGFRGRPVEARPGPDTLRIVGIGDSTMFGWGVADGKDYLSLLGERLDREYPGRSWEIVNTAVPGSNTAMEVATLEVEGLRYQPDLVVIDVNANDIQLPYFLLEREDFLTLEKSFLFEFVRDRLKGVREVGSTSPRLEKREYVKLADTELDRIPPVYRDMVGWPAFERSVAKLQDLAETHGFEVVTTCAHGSFPKYGRRFLAGRGIPPVCAAKARRRYLEERDLALEPLSVMSLSEDDSHPSELGHQLLADLLFDRLVESGFIERQVGDVPPVRSSFAP